MKALYRISLLINFIGLVFLLIKGGEILAKNWDAGQPGMPEKVYAVRDAGQAAGAVTPAGTSGTAGRTASAGISGADGFPGQGVLSGQPADAAQMEEADSGLRSPVAAQPAEAAREASAGEMTTSCDTVCHLLRSDLADGSEVETICEIPSAYIGKTREQLIQLIELYNQSPPLEEQKEGFVSMELVAFSRSDLTVRKVYESDPFYCCIVVEDDFLTVYDARRENVILYTDIALGSLPAQIAQEVIDGKYIKTQQQLYDFLESYSS